MFSCYFVQLSIYLAYSSNSKYQHILCATSLYEVGLGGKHLYNDHLNFIFVINSFSDASLLFDENKHALIFIYNLIRVSWGVSQNINSIRGFHT